MIQTVPPLPTLVKAIGSLERRHGDAKPSVFIADQAGSTLVDWSMSPLPTPLTGITKLYTLAMMLRECDRGAITLDTPISDLLEPDMVSGLCVVNGKDLSSTITIAHLISHQSGIVDYYRAEAPGTRSFYRQTQETDRSWSVDQALEIAKHYPGRFAPGARKQLEYSNTNYLLLGVILNSSTGMSFEQLVSLRISGPLGLKSTSVFTPAHYDTYFSILPTTLDARSVRAPRALASFGASGSIISNARDAVTFLRAFWSGQLFSDSWMDILLGNQRKMGPGVSMSNGLMVHRRGRSKGALVGHTGSSGTALLVDTATGTTGFLAVNTVGKHSQSLRTLGALIDMIN